VTKPFRKLASKVAMATPWGAAIGGALKVTRMASKALRKPLRAGLRKIVGRKASRAIERAADFATDVGYVSPDEATRALGISRWDFYRGGVMPRNDVGALEGLVYVVESNDFGTKIAEKLIGDGSRWRELKAANPAVARRPDPRGYGMVIYPGDRLELPTSWVAELGLDAPADEPPPAVAAGSDDLIYVVKSGDTGVSIAEQFTGSGSRWRELRDANPQIRNRPDPHNWGMVIFAGDRLTLPSSWVAAAPPVSVEDDDDAPPVEPPPPASPPPVSVEDDDDEPADEPPPPVAPPPPVSVEDDDDEPAELEPPPPVAPPARSGGALLPLALAAAGWAMGLF
jgi:nucleoid-associated protein YgaU